MCGGQKPLRYESTTGIYKFTQYLEDWAINGTMALGVVANDCVRINAKV